MSTPSLLPILAAALLGQHVVVVPLDALAPPPEVEEAPPVEALVDEVEVRVDPADETRVEMRWTLRALSPGWVDLPVTGAALAMDSATLDGVPVAMDPGPDGVRRLTAFLDGRHELVVSGTVQTLESRLSLPLLTAARATVTVAGGPWDVELEDGVVRAGQQFDLVQTERLALSWQPAAPPAPRATVIRGEGAVAFQVDGAGTQASAVVRYRIRHGSVESLRVGLPGAVSDVTVEGAGVREQRRVGDEVEVQFSRPVEGSVTLQLGYRVAPAEGDDLAALPVPWSRDTQELWVSVLRGDESMVVPEPTRGLDPVIAGDLPEWATGLAPGEPVAAYRAAGSAPELWARVLRYEPVEEPPTLVDEARYEVAYTSHGRVLLRARYQVRNDRNQYLHVMPPEGYEPIGARVAGIVAQPAADGGGGLYVPLEKSVETLEGLVSFPVEVLFWGDEAEWDDRGTRTLVAPSVDAPIAYARWEVVLPPDREARAAVSDATLVERWTDRDKGLTYGRAHGEAMRDEENDRNQAEEDSKKKTKGIQVVQRSSRRGPPPPMAPKPRKKTGWILGGGGAKAPPPMDRPPEDPAKPVYHDDQSSLDEARELQQELSEEVFNQAYAKYKQNKFEEAGDLLEKSLEIDPGNRSAAALQSNVGVFVGEGKSGGKGEDEVLSRRVRELAQAKTQGQQVEQERRKKEAEKAFRSGDMERAQEEYRRLVEVTEELAVVEQAETWEQKSQLESYQRQLDDIDRQVAETKEEVLRSKASLELLDQTVATGRSFSTTIEYGEQEWGGEEIEGGGVGGVEGGVVGGVVGGVLGGVLGGVAGDDGTELAGQTGSITTYDYGVPGEAGAVAEPLSSPGYSTTSAYNFEDIEISGELVAPTGPTGGEWLPATTPEPAPEPEQELLDIPDRYVRLVLPAEDIASSEDFDGYQDEDGLPDFDMDGDHVIDVESTGSYTTLEVLSKPADGVLLDRKRANYEDPLYDVRVDFDDIELAPGSFAIVFDEEDEEEFEGDWKPPVEPLVQVDGAPAQGGRSRGRATSSFAHRGRGERSRDDGKRDDHDGRWSGVGSDAPVTADPVADEGRVAKPERKAPVVHVTASALSIRVPRAGQSLRFEQRLIPENTPMTVELRYKTARRSSDGRNR